MGYIEAVVADRSLRVGINIYGVPCSSVGRAIPVGDQRFFVTIIITGGDTLAE